MKSLSIIPLILLLAPLLLAPLFVSAQLFGDYCPPYDPYVPCSDMCFRDYCISRTPGFYDGPCGELYNYGDYCPLKICCVVVRAGRWLYFIGMGLALVILTWAGIVYMTAGGEETKVSKAKKILLYGIIGAVLLYAAGYILNTVVGFLY